MRLIVKKSVLVCLMLLASAGYAREQASDLLVFPSEEMRVRYLALNEELRCPKCQNQNLADSNSMIAEDLRIEVRRLLLEGRSDRQIKAHLVERYGDFVLYNPPVKPSTWLLWLAPGVLLLIMLVIPLVVTRRKRQMLIETEPGHGTQDKETQKKETQKKLDELLSGAHSNSVAQQGDQF